MPNTAGVNGNKIMRTTTSHRRLRDSYFDLVRAFPLRPIRSEDDFDRATAVLIKLAASKPEQKMDAGERDYMETLAVLTQKFEQGRRSRALPQSTPIERLKFLMEEQGMNINGLGRVIGSQPSASLILSGKRFMSKSQILKLAKYFAVSPALFMV